MCWHASPKGEAYPTQAPLITDVHTAPPTTERIKGHLLLVLLAPAG